MKSIKFIDLFAGLGGIRLGLEKAAKELGLETECVFTSEIKTSASTTYKVNFNKDNHEVFGDITKVDESLIPDFDILLGGFPCQAFSLAGKRLGFEDTRGTLFFDVARIIKEKQPSAFLLENVEGLVIHDKGRTLQTIENTLMELGYIISYKVLNASDFGLAQNRKRIYIVGTKTNYVSLDNFDLNHSILADILEETPPLENDFGKLLIKNIGYENCIGKKITDKRGDNIHGWDIECKGTLTADEKSFLNDLLKERRKKKWSIELGIPYMDGVPLTLKQIRTFSNIPLDSIENLVSLGYLYVEHPKTLVSGKRVYDETLPKGYNIVTGNLSYFYNRILDPLSITPTLVATDSKKLAVPIQNGFRPLTITECKRLFGYPDDFYIPEKYYWDLLGNSVCVPVIEEISKRLLKVLVPSNDVESLKTKVN